MTGWLPSPVEELFGPEATADESYDVLTVDVPPAQWITALETARTTLACTYFDWLSAVDEPGTGFRVCAHVVALSPVRRLLLRTTVAHEAPALASAVGVYAGAAWHERETHEMFGVTFEGHPGLAPLLLPDSFEGHPLRKDFVLAARVAKAWPGAKEPGESEHGGPKRRQMLPPGVPDPNEWGPLKGQLPPAPARPARGAGRAGAAGAGATGAGSAADAAGRAAGAAGRAPGERPVRRNRSVSQGSASQAAPTPPPEAATATPDEPEPQARPPRRSRSASQGSASQRTESPAPATPQPSGTPEAPGTPEGTASPEAEAPASPEAPASAPAAAKPAAPRGSDAPWHHARPAYEPTDQPKPKRPRTTGRTGVTAEPEPTTGPDDAPDADDTRDTGGSSGTGNTTDHTDTTDTTDTGSAGGHE
ncbi:NADH-quinone oxidoreductase subunit C [Streptomyces alfalfae]|uniref:NADH-quinone oxidoreductase subunit C n=1 Tax=Streptomyces alfalfae TaxID=1642299 RepID=A0A7T4TYZ7_9ACTN|nr:NADH-quinone oxidoreductase subunit C [Streptomyces alfalfae]QQC90829.1 NADH-quinone oxidoreductase subunit C [Streptomyces alfalfae]